MTGFASLLLVVASVTTASAVTVPGDFGSIQAAINAVVSGQVPDGSVINIQPGTYNEALLINTTSKSMTLRALSGPGTVVVDGTAKNTSVIQILAAPGAIVIDGLTFRNGHSPDNGHAGGFTFQDTAPTLVNTTFENNSSAVNGGAGLFIRSNATFQGCMIQNNTAVQFGGALLIGQGSRPTFSGCTIQGNTSGTGAAFGNGGAVHINDASPTFIASRILNNRGKLAGGGIFAIAAFGSPNGEATVTLQDSVVSGNSVVPGPDGSSEGGGLHVEDFAVGIVRRTTVSGNSAITGGGATAHRARWVIDESIFENNTATAFGGGASGQSNNVVTPLQRAASIVVTNSVFRNNTAGAGGGIAIGGDQVCGGSCSSNTAALKATLQISNSILDGNTANGLGGGGVIVGRTNFTMTNSLVSRNQATSSNGFGGGLWILDATVATLTDVRVARNTSAGFGGGIFGDTDATINMATSSLHNNSAPSGNGGGLFIGQQGNNTGSVTNSVFVDNAGTDIVESCPATSAAPYLSHTNTKFGMATGTVYDTKCAPPGSPGARDVRGFGALPRASGIGTIGLADVQARALFLAAPADSPSVLGWSVIRATSVTINPGQTFNVNPQAGTTDVTVAQTTAYGLSANTSLGSLNPALSATVLGPPVRFGAPGDLPVQADYDGDRRTDFAVYRPSTGDWFIFSPTSGFRTINFGAPALSGLQDTPVPADYDGDGRADVAIYRKGTGEWFLFGSSTGFRSTVFGAPAASGLGDIPVPGDYDGDGKTDIAIYRQGTGEWFIFGSATGFRTTVFGAPAVSGLGDIPVQGDYDGDGKTDIAIYRQATGQWFIFGSATGFQTIVFGAPIVSGLGDLPVPADYDGDRRTDLAIRRTSTNEWFIFQSSLGFTQTTWGAPTDFTAVGDYNGDRKAQVGVWRSGDGSWRILP